MLDESRQSESSNLASRDVSPDSLATPPNRDLAAPKGRISNNVKNPTAAQKKESKKLGFSGDRDPSKRKPNLAAAVVESAQKKGSSNTMKPSPRKDETVNKDLKKKKTLRVATIAAVATSPPKKNPGAQGTSSPQKKQGTSSGGGLLYKPRKQTDWWNSSSAAISLTAVSAVSRKIVLKDPNAEKKKRKKSHIPKMEKFPYFALTPAEARRIANEFYAIGGLNSAPTASADEEDSENPSPKRSRTSANAAPKAPALTSSRSKAGTTDPDADHSHIYVSEQHNTSETRAAKLDLLFHKLGLKSVLFGDELHALMRATVTKRIERERTEELERSRRKASDALLSSFLKPASQKMDDSNSSRSSGSESSSSSEDDTNEGNESLRERVRKRSQSNLKTTSSMRSTATGDGSLARTAGLSPSQRQMSVTFRGRSPAARPLSSSLRRGTSARTPTNRQSSPSGHREAIADEASGSLQTPVGASAESSMILIEDVLQVCDELKLLHRAIVNEKNRDILEAYVASGGNRDKSGHVDAALLKKRFTMFDLTLDFDRLLAEIDEDGSGEIEFDEFVTLLSSLGHTEGVAAGREVEPASAFALFGGDPDDPNSRILISHIEENMDKIVGDDDSGDLEWVWLRRLELASAQAERPGSLTFEEFEQLVVMQVDNELVEADEDFMNVNAPPLPQAIQNAKQAPPSLQMTKSMSTSGFTLPSSNTNPATAGTSERQQLAAGKAKQHKVIQAFLMAAGGSLRGTSPAALISSGDPSSSSGGVISSPPTHTTGGPFQAAHGGSDSRQVSRASVFSSASPASRRGTAHYFARNRRNSVDLDTAADGLQAKLDGTWDRYRKKHPDLEDADATEDPVLPPLIASGVLGSGKESSPLGDSMYGASADKLDQTTSSLARENRKEQQRQAREGVFRRRCLIPRDLSYLLTLNENLLISEYHLGISSATREKSGGRSPVSGRNTPQPQGGGFLSSTESVGEHSVGIDNPHLSRRRRSSARRLSLSASSKGKPPLPTSPTQQQQEGGGAYEGLPSLSQLPTTPQQHKGAYNTPSPRGRRNQSNISPILQTMKEKMWKCVGVAIEWLKYHRRCDFCNELNRRKEEKRKRLEAIKLNHNDEEELQERPANFPPLKELRGSVAGRRADGRLGYSSSGALVIYSSPEGAGGGSGEIQSGGASAGGALMPFSPHPPSGKKKYANTPSKVLSYDHGDRQLALLTKKMASGSSSVSGARPLTHPSPQSFTPQNPTPRRLGGGGVHGTSSSLVSAPGTVPPPISDRPSLNSPNETPLATPLTLSRRGLHGRRGSSSIRRGDSKPEFDITPVRPPPKFGSSTTKDAKKSTPSTKVPPMALLSPHPAKKTEKRPRSKKRNSANKNHQEETPSSQMLQSTSSAAASRKPAINRGHTGAYFGEWQGEQRHGKGKCFYDSGDVYEGEWKNDKRHGNGTLERLSSARPIPKKNEEKGPNEEEFQWEKFTGEFERDRFHGNGTMTWPNGQVYTGEFREGAMHGNGEMQYVVPSSSSSSSTPVGAVSPSCSAVSTGAAEKEDGHDDAPSPSRAVSTSYSVHYNGEWQFGQRSSRGKCIYSNGDTYTGLWKHDKFHGKGKLVYGDGSVYIGEFRGGQKHGKGKYTHPPVYQSVMEASDRYGRPPRDGANNNDDMKDQSSGNEKQREKPRSYYEGHWEKDKKHGQGLFVEYLYPDDEEEELEAKTRNGEEIPPCDVYDGRWARGKRSGYGVQTYGDSYDPMSGEQIFYSGMWNHDKPSDPDFQVPLRKKARVVVPAETTSSNSPPLQIEDKRHEDSNDDKLESSNKDNENTSVYEAEEEPTETYVSPPPAKEETIAATNNNSKEDEAEQDQHQANKSSSSSASNPAEEDAQGNSLSQSPPPSEPTFLVTQPTLKEEEEGEQETSPMLPPDQDSTAALQTPPTQKKRVGEEVTNNGTTGEVTPRLEVERASTATSSLRFSEGGNDDDDETSDTEFTIRAASASREVMMNSALDANFTPRNDTNLKASSEKEHAGGATPDGRSIVSFNIEGSTPSEQLNLDAPETAASPGQGSVFTAASSPEPSTADEEGDRSKREGGRSVEGKAGAASNPSSSQSSSFTEEELRQQELEEALAHVPKVEFRQRSEIIEDEKISRGVVRLLKKEDYTKIISQGLVEEESRHRKVIIEDEEPRVREDLRQREDDAQVEHNEDTRSFYGLLTSRLNKEQFGGRNEIRREEDIQRAAFEMQFSSAFEGEKESSSHGGDALAERTANTLAEDESTARGNLKRQQDTQRRRIRKLFIDHSPFSAQSQMLTSSIRSASGGSQSGSQFESSARSVDLPPGAQGICVECKTAVMNDEKFLRDAADETSLIHEACLEARKNRVIHCAQCGEPIEEESFREITFQKFGHDGEGGDTSSSSSAFFEETASVHQRCVEYWKIAKMMEEDERKAERAKAASAVTELERHEQRQQQEEEKGIAQRKEKKKKASIAPDVPTPPPAPPRRQSQQQQVSPIVLMFSAEEERNRRELEQKARKRYRKIHRLYVEEEEQLARHDLEKEVAESFYGAYIDHRSCLEKIAALPQRERGTTTDPGLAPNDNDDDDDFEL